ncbi:MAG: hypothetical protein CSA55_03820 [Ilumatobacter coccineus]|uniref:Carbohydrate kinase PfkB domain-containing protein n=1 Tax=Ilumatobacter coccineus TaxID=467094 RepID=A0A2G6KBM2_9ACTN|nr:MAG: hypothetical protein CSA55_03820 [Ilumatobacter coccineus]
MEHAETRLILIRHGESKATVERFLGGPASCTGLSELGVAQAERLHDRIVATGEPQVDVVLASPLPRARRTADIIAPAWGREVLEDRELMEHDPGPICDGMAIDEFIDTYGMPDWNDDPFVRFFPDGETIGDLHTRIGKAITRIVDTYQGQTVALVCHGGVISVALRIALTAPIIGRFELPTVNTSITELIHLRPGRWRIGRYNDAAHLAGLPTYTPPQTTADIVVRLGGPIQFATDTPSVIERRRGGSASNTAVAVTLAGRKSRFLGQVGDDTAGRGLIDEMERAGVEVSSIRRRGRTGSIVVLVDADGERTMLTDRGSSTDLTDPDPAWLNEVGMLHVPWYSLAGGAIAATARTVIEWAHEASIDVSIDVSSVSVLDEIGSDAARAAISALEPAIVFANADEATYLGLDGPLGTALTVVKQGPDPAIVFSADGRRADRAPIRLPDGTDTTGAGDAFAAGFLDAWLTKGDADLDHLLVAGHRIASAVLGRPNPI